MRCACATPVVSQLRQHFLVAKSYFEIVRTFITFFFIVFDLLTIVLFSDVFFVESEADNVVFLRLGV